MNLRYLFKILCSTLILTLVMTTPVNATESKILTSIKPIHSLVSGLTKNISTPGLLIKGFQSPHDYSLKPSDRRLIQRAEIIIYTSATLESFLPHILKSQPQATIIELIDIPGIERLPARGMSHHDSDHDEHDHHGNFDNHIWLSVNNAKTIVKHLSSVFAQHDPENKIRYEQNSQILLNKLDTLQQTILKQLKPVSQKPFLMFHDAFQYFEHEFGMERALFVTTSPDHKIGIQRIRLLKSKIKQHNIQCIYYEPPSLPPIVETITEDHKVSIQPLDPIGTAFNDGAELYFNLLQDISSKLHSCLINF